MQLRSTKMLRNLFETEDRDYNSTDAFVPLK